MKRTSSMLLATVLLAACATQPTEERSATFSSQPGQPESDARQRARVFTELAVAYYVRGQYKISMEELRKAITVDNRFGPAYNVYGLIYMELGEDGLAEENFRRAIEIDRNDSEARNNYGWFLCTRGRFDEGLEQFTQALRNPLYASPEQAMVNAGLCAERKGDMALAETNLQRALKLQPDNPNTILKLAGMRYRQGQLAEAQRLLARHAELAPPTAESLWLGVRVERRLGNREQEAAYGLQLRKHFSDSPEARRLQVGEYE